MQIEISGVAPHIDGSYELNWGSFSTREQHEIRLISGIRPAEYLDATMSGDAAFAGAMAMVALQRVNKRLPEEMMFNAPAGSFKFAFPDKGADADPPTTPSRRPKRPTTPGTSGRASRKSSASRADAQSHSGDRT